MALPLIYNLRACARAGARRWWPCSGSPGTVGVFVAMLALARGFQAALVASGSPQNAMVRRAGATSEIDSAVTLEQLRVIEDAPEVRARRRGARW